MACGRSEAAWERHPSVDDVSSRRTPGKATQAEIEHHERAGMMTSGWQVCTGFRIIGGILGVDVEGQQFRPERTLVSR